MTIGSTNITWYDILIVPSVISIWTILSNTELPYLFDFVVIGCICYTYKISNQLTLQYIVQSFLYYVTRIFFRDISYRGVHRVPSSGPVIFVCAPHANQFLDPLMVMQAVGRNVGFLAAAKSMRRKYIGILATVLGSISVERAQDLAVTGEGKVTTTEHGKYIHGKNTKFTKYLKSGFTIVVKSEALTVDTVISDIEIKTTGGTTLEADANEPVKWAHAPKVDQHRVFENVWAHLQHGECIGIFPEGGSHDRSDLLPLKAGVTIMALGAEAKYPGLGVKIVPVGLNYFSGHRFRSRAYIDVGEPIIIPNELVESYKHGGQDKRDACSTLLDIIQQRLKSVTVTAPNHEVLQLIWAIRRLYKPEGMKLTTAQKLELTRRFELMYNKLADEPRVQLVKQQVHEYNSHLQAFGLRDHQVNRTTLSTYHALPVFIYRITLLLFYAIISLPGAILCLPVLIIARIISTRKAAEAKAASTVKLTGRDVMGTWKLLVSMSLVPICFVVYPIIAALCGSYSGYGAVRVWAYFALFQPFIMYGSVRFVETGREIARSLIPLFYSIIHSSAALQLIEERRKLQHTIRQMADEIGPQFFGGQDEFEKFRIVKGNSIQSTNSTSNTNTTTIKRNWSGLNFDSYNGYDSDKSPRPSISHNNKQHHTNSHHSITEDNTTNMNKPVELNRYQSAQSNQSDSSTHEVSSPSAHSTLEHKYSIPHPNQSAVHAH